MKFAHHSFFSSILTVLFTADPDPGNNPAPETIKLPQPVHNGKTSWEKVLQEHHSIREYQKLPITLSEISQLLWAAQGISKFTGRRTAPSAGALYPLEVYVIIGNVIDLPAGIYTYDSNKHEIARIETGAKRIPLCKAALGQTSVKDTAAVVVLTSVYKRTIIKYGERGIRYAQMEAGHAAQNVSLQSVSLGLGTVVVGAFHDEEVKLIAGLSGHEAPLYIIPVGRK